MPKPGLRRSYQASSTPIIDQIVWSLRPLCEPHDAAVVDRDHKRVVLSDELVQPAASAETKQAREGAV
jgi:hypothetical protein